MTTAQLRTVATTMTGREMAEASRKTAVEAGSATVKRFFEANRGTLEALLPKHFDSERMLKLALGALRTTPKLSSASLSSLEQDALLHIYKLLRQ
jgi:recombination protein RecT